MNGYYTKVVEILKQHGFYRKRSGKGSHELWTDDKVSVTVSRNCDSRHTADGIMKQAGIAHRF